MSKQFTFKHDLIHRCQTQGLEKGRRESKITREFDTADLDGLCCIPSLRPPEIFFLS